MWELHGFEYDGLVWKDTSEKPTLHELESQYEDILLELEKEKIDKSRRLEYSKRSDPKYFEYQRGECTKEDWLSEVEAIKIEYPYPS